MYTSKLALLVLLTASAACAYPTTSPNELAVADGFPAQLHDTPMSAVAAERGPVAPRAVPRIDGARDEEKRQIHNADYHAEAPPPSPDQAAPAQASPSSSPSPNPNSKAAAADADAPAPKDASKEPKDKREYDTDASFYKSGPGPVSPSNSRSSSGPGSTTNEQSQSQSQQEQVDVDDDDVAVRERSTVVSRLSKIGGGDWHGFSRRDVEEKTNPNNRDFDHDAVMRWNQAEVDRMDEKWRKMV
ncbi:hypothetical protein HMN09_00285400 [Mycena chlorophos]|uniref:Uncharacterized protein n=1 Tax=Mycena chlorophos TaxID=658473 RepID=A0A8H6TIN2_MYCCL|nr:hypothetical protein HMN09_00285400 [Mycena chlorophos]